MLKSEIQKQLKQAMKSKDELRLSTLKLLLSSLNYEEIEKRGELNETEELAVVKKEAKKRKDAIAIYDTNPSASAKEKSQREQSELKILQEFMPQELSQEEIEKIILETIKEIDAKSISDMGKVMGEVMKRTQGAADGRLVSEIVKEALTK